MCQAKKKLPRKGPITSSFDNDLGSLSRTKKFFLKWKERIIKNKKILFQMGVSLFILILIWMISAIILDSYGLYFRNRDNLKGEGDKFDLIIIPGTSIHGDGKPSSSFEQRLALGAQLFHEGYAPKIALTGGVGIGMPMSEAEVGARYLIYTFGISKDDLILEDKSRTTQENAFFLSQIIGSSEAKKLNTIVVSDTYHCWRCNQLFRKYFGNSTCVGSISPMPIRRIRGALREVLAVLKNAVLGHLLDYPYF